MTKCFPLLFLLLLACGDDDAPPPEVDAGAGRDSAVPPPLDPYSYTPEGCSYDVTVPQERATSIAAGVEAGPSEDVVGAAPTPVFVHASFPGPTDSGFAVIWSTDVDTLVSHVLYGTDEAAVTAADGPGGEVSAQTGHHALLTPLPGGGDITRLHEVHVCGLAANTSVFYKVGGPGAWSRVFNVGTAPAAGAPDAFRFAVSGDSRNDSVIWAEVQKSIGDLGADFQIFTGDAVVLGPNQAEWVDFFSTEFDGVNVQDVLGEVPIMPTNGNHEGLALNYVLQFALPQDVSGAERAQGEEWYSFDYGNAHFVVLDSEAVDDADQLAWLEADLGAVDRTTTPWIIAMHHRPPYSCSNHGSDIALRGAWQPLYDRFGVDVVFTGHDHEYERSFPIRDFMAGSPDGAVATMGPEMQPVDGSGTMYVVSGGAGAPLYSTDTSCYHTHIAESVRNFTVVDLDGLTMRYAAYRLDGTVLDMFEYTKSAATP